MRVITVMMIVMLLASITSCHDSKGIKCLDGGEHQWGKWEESGVYLIDGSRAYRHYCIICNWGENDR